LTLHTFLRSLFSTSNTLAGNPNKPGARRSGVDFSYRIPGLRDGMTFYAEGLAEHDEITPIIGPTSRLGWQEYTSPGCPRSLNWTSESRAVIPILPTAGATSHMALSTGMQLGSPVFRMPSLMGSWMGRQGQGAQAWTTYWFSPRNKLQFGFRHQKVSQQFIPNGGTLADANVRVEFWPRSSSACPPPSNTSCGIFQSSRPPDSQM